MDEFLYDNDECADCPERLVCHCLQVTEGEIVKAICTEELNTIREIRRHTKAGSGCNACQARLQTYLDRFAYSLPICSVK